MRGGCGGVEGVSEAALQFLDDLSDDVFGRPGLLFPWDGFQWYSLLGIRSMFIRGVS